MISSIGASIHLAIFFAVLNTMLMAGRERTRDVGIMKALGFGNGVAMALLVCESVIVCLLGAALGVGAGFALEPGFQAATASFLPGFAFDQGALLLGGGIALVVGLVSGVLPGLRAARLSAVDAIQEVG